jgi:hypothetical protein
VCAMRYPNAIVRGEPEIADVSVMRVTYRCAQCGLVERKNVITSRVRRIARLFGLAAGPVLNAMAF